MEKQLRSVPAATQTGSRAKQQKGPFVKDARKFFEILTPPPLASLLGTFLSQNRPIFGPLPPDVLYE